LQVISLSQKTNQTKQKFFITRAPDRAFCAGIEIGSHKAFAFGKFGSDLMAGEPQTVASDCDLPRAATQSTKAAVLCRREFI